jgi:hypothetical protein
MITNNISWSLGPSLNKSLEPIEPFIPSHPSDPFNQTPPRPDCVPFPCPSMERETENSIKFRRNSAHSTKKFRLFRNPKRLNCATLSRSSTPFHFPPFRQSGGGGQGGEARPVLPSVLSTRAHSTIHAKMFSYCSSVYSVRVCGLEAVLKELSQQLQEGRN